MFDENSSGGIEVEELKRIFQKGNVSDLVWKKMIG